MYLFGGNTDDKLLNDLFCFDMEKHAWTLLKPIGRLPAARDRHSLTFVDNKLFLFGGRSADSEYLNDLHGMCIDIL
jgi:hypothetical protein